MSTRELEESAGRELYEVVFGGRDVLTLFERREAQQPTEVSRCSSGFSPPRGESPRFRGS